MKAKVIYKGDYCGFGKKWEYRGYVIVFNSASDYSVYKGGSLVCFTSNLGHAKELIDHRISRNAE